MNATVLASRPAHVPPELVVDFDYREPPGHTSDVHLAWKKLHDGPDIVWTPRHGGHWIATRADDIDVMQTDHTRFSYRFVTVPPLREAPQLAPLEYDPPEHTPYRQLLSPAFGPAVMQQLEGDLRRLALELLEQIVPRGRCEFFDDFAKRLPVITFLRLVNLPLEDREHLLELTEKSVRPSPRPIAWTQSSGCRSTARNGSSSAGAIRGPTCSAAWSTRSSMAARSTSTS